MNIDIPNIYRYDFRHTNIESIEPMETVTVSPKFQVVIPRDIRDRLGLTPGQKLQAIAYENRVELIPLRPAAEMRGFLAGIDTEVARENDRA